MPFLTELDPRAKIKGSRDPLGFQPIWTGLGRNVVGNFTATTGSIRNFTTLLIGLHFAERAIQAGLADESERCNLFMRFEQIAAYSRHMSRTKDSGNGERILGITRVVKNWDQTNHKPYVSAKPTEQILSNQKIYGIWGLYTVASRRSRMVEESGHRLAPLGQDFVESQYLPRLQFGTRSRSSDLTRLITQNFTFEPKVKHQQIAKALSQVLAPSLTATERQIYYQQFLLGDPGYEKNPTHGKQQTLWHTWQAMHQKDAQAWKREFNYEELIELTRTARALQKDGLAQSLQNILDIEPLLSCLNQVFLFSINRKGSTVKEVADVLRNRWGLTLNHIQSDAIEALESQLADEIRLGTKQAKLLGKLAKLLRAGAYEEAIESVFQQNALVMRDRGGAAWVELKNNKIDVRLRSEIPELASAEKLPILWTNPYFLNTMKNIGATLEGYV